MQTNQTNFEQALAGLTDYFLSDLPQIDEDIEFSDKFKRQMEKLIKRWKKPYYMLINTAAKRAACVIVCIIVALSALTISVKAFLPDVWNIIVERFDEYVAVGFQAESETVPKTIEEIIAPKYVPEGLAVSGKKDTPAIYTTRYYSQDGEAVCMVSQNIYGHSVNITNKASIQDISVLQYEGLLFINNNHRMLLWGDEKYCYFIDVYDPSFPDDELMAIAESIYE